MPKAKRKHESSSDFVFLVRPCQFPLLDYLMEQIPSGYSRWATR